jgi:hypothetical protein
MLPWRTYAFELRTEGTMNKVNPWAVIVAAVVHWILAAGWFTVFGPTWLAGSGFTPERVKEIQAHPDPWPYVIAFVSNLVMALVLAKVIAWVGQWSAAGGIRVGAVLGFGIAFCAMTTAYVFEYKPLSFILISAGYPVVGMMIMGLIIGVWKPKGA